MTSTLTRMKMVKTKIVRRALEWMVKKTKHGVERLFSWLLFNSDLNNRHQNPARLTQAAKSLKRKSVQYKSFRNPAGLTQATKSPKNAPA